MANRNFSNGGKLYTMHVKPVMADCKFTVAATAAAGQSSLFGPLIAQVFGHTSNGTPAVYKGITNRMPAGYFQIFLSDNYNVSLALISAQATPLSGSSIPVTTGTTQGSAYVITTVGTTSQAQWQRLGVPAGTLAAVGVAFIAIATTTATGTGTIQAPAAAGAGIGCIEIVGNPSATLANQQQPTNGGGYFIIRCMSATSSSVTTAEATQPADGTQIQLAMLINDSSVPS